MCLQHRLAQDGFQRVNDICGRQHQRGLGRCPAARDKLAARTYWRDGIDNARMRRMPLCT